MLKIDCDLKGIENYIIDTQISVQKVLKKSLNAAINKAHKEGYKLIKQEFGISKEEYKKSRTELKKVRMSNFKYRDVISANIKAEDIGMNYINISNDKSVTPLRGIKKARRRPVVAHVKGIRQRVKGAFIARGKETKKTKKRYILVFRKTKNNKFQSVKTPSIHQILTRENDRLEHIAEKEFHRVFDKNYKK